MPSYRALRGRAHAELRGMSPEARQIKVFLKQGKQAFRLPRRLTFEIFWLASGRGVSTAARHPVV
jgi:hypothetical protein